jgi:hypothetical protein
MRPGRTTLVVIAAMCAILAVAPQTAIAGKKKKAYEGTVATQGVEGQTPTIQLKVQFRRKGGKLVPDYVANLRHRAIALFCPDGTTTFVGPFNTESGAVGNFAQPGFIPYPGAVGFKPFKNGRYTLTLTGDAADSNGTADLLQLTTRVSSKGAATGTIRLVATSPTQGGRCDSGTVSYTAPRVASLSPAP